MRRRVFLLICFCLVIYLTACDNSITDNSAVNESSIIESDDTSDKSDDDISADDLLREKYLPVEITASISDDKPEYRFTKRITDTISEGSEEYTKAVVDVYELGTTEKLIDSIEMLVYLSGGFNWFSQAAWESLSVIDVNFDGYKDIVVISLIGGTQGMHSYNCFTWNEEASKFEVASFPEWGFVSIDADRKMLLASWRNWAASHGWAIYEYIDGALTKTNECNREYLSDADDGTAIIHLKAVQLIDSEMQTVFYGNVNEDELDAYLLYDNLWQLGSENWVGVWKANETESN